MLYWGGFLVYMTAWHPSRELGRTSLATVAQLRFNTLSSIHKACETRSMHGRDVFRKSVGSTGSIVRQSCALSRAVNTTRTHQDTKPSVSTPTSRTAAYTPTDLQTGQHPALNKLQASQVLTRKEDVHGLVVRCCCWCAHRSCCSCWGRRGRCRAGG
jgi:hypothetical protein